MIRYQDDWLSCFSRWTLCLSSAPFAKDYGKMECKSAGDAFIVSILANFAHAEEE